MKLLHGYFERLRGFIDRRWYVPAISLLAALDLFIVVVPTDALVISSVLGKKKRLFGPALWVATGSALGAVALGLIIQLDIPFIARHLLDPLFQSDVWQATDRFLDQYGIWALALSALSPAPQQPAVVLGALAGMEPQSVFISVWLGRVIKYGFFVWCAYHAPRLLWRVMAREDFVAPEKQSGTIQRD